MNYTTLGEILPFIIFLGIVLFLLFAYIYAALSCKHKEVVHDEEKNGLFCTKCGKEVNIFKD